MANAVFVELKEANFRVCLLVLPLIPIIHHRRSNFLCVISLISEDINFKYWYTFFAV